MVHLVVSIFGMDTSRKTSGTFLVFIIKQTTKIINP